MKLRILGNTIIDKHLFKLYGYNKDTGGKNDNNIDVILDFWHKYIPSLKSEIIYYKTEYSIEIQFLNIYVKMISNIMIDCIAFNQVSDNTNPFVKYQWASTSNNFECFFKYVLDILKNDMKSHVFREIIIQRNTSEFKKFIDAKFYCLGYENLFNDDEFDYEQYLDYLICKNKIWRVKNDENITILKNMELKLIKKIKIYSRYYHDIN